jgi:hypothetical protein
MAASDPSPLGDTTEHAGEQTEVGETADDPEGAGGGEGGGGAERRGPERGDPGREDPSLSPGGTAHAPRPESEQLANRHQV